ncbi:hypothetical protein EEL32_18255 [Brevibacillus laterosporus]|uniref:Uncharacterized protein n=1 Tax=Brevibacillus laterosporus TaxID=1465 RepID=A0A502ICF6_BRELA|nr:hypothetical protein [Brevibacillus laterosporus]QDX94551.1 hypothetical protein EEL30_21095 [Brevibacillus laterosporus]RAP30877.1 hypothetical protein C2W64_00044 [Brevibacillus laterosporus]TPG68440.1 hypothetical protein EEL31_07845 [Brevibacillus laterosporus]TPG83048.1 hypothetical protein EEL32_18255 [Brevibacillus laterosporus]
MLKPFERFTSELNWQQLSLLLDTVMYFEDALKYLSIPSQSGESISVPLHPETLRLMLEEFEEEQAFEKKSVTFDFTWTSEEESHGLVHVTLPSGRELTQRTNIKEFSMV